MTHQIAFAHAEFGHKKKTTRREKFLARMEEVIPWSASAAFAINPMLQVALGGPLRVESRAWHQLGDHRRIKHNQPDVVSN
jgi:hypothetical protein